MTFPLSRAAALLMLAAAAVMPMATLAGGNHGHDDHHAEEAAKGPNGGTLLEQGDIALEITIFEQGIPPEMRVYAYRDGQLLSAQQWQLAVELARLGGTTERLSFVAEGDYLVSQQVVSEPHSFDVAIEAEVAGGRYHWDYESHEGRTTISERLLALSGVETSVVAPRQLRFTETLFGVVQPVQDRVYSVSAPYDGIIESLHVSIGQQVKKGDTVATVRSSDTLQQYSVKAPADGEITALTLNQGDHTRGGALLELADLSKVWIDLSAFPNVLEKLRVGMPLSVLTMHDAESGHDGVQTTLSYIAPTMTGGHIARARAVIDNADGQWRPGMHVQAEVLTEQRQVPMAVSVEALQRFRDMDVVFGRFGNTFEVRMLELGGNDGRYVEVLGGIRPGTEYVTRNSYLLLADVMKDAASHNH
ncbi:efflux RND transporter periplasmic adaptor subunit [Halomonas denitrificans]|nr:efflux RND transporter periplasmic adaptor subunit [Halomonas denitrificans]